MGPPPQQHLARQEVQTVPVMRGVSAAGLEEGAVVASEVVEARLVQQIVAWVEACSKRALFASLLFDLRLQEAVALAGARVIASSHVHQRRVGLPLGGRPAWTERERSWVVRSVWGKEVTWLQGAGQGEGGVVPTHAMRDEVARQRRLLGLGQEEVVDQACLERGVDRGSLLRHAVDTSRQLEEAHASWQLDWAYWQAAERQRSTRPYRPPSPFALTTGCSCKAHHIKLDTKAIFGLMRTAGMLPADITSLPKFRNGVAGPRDR
ncbi:hypothetical protein V8C86DRAFT_2430608 [Haematococcus lacustris]